MQLYNENIEDLAEMKAKKEKGERIIATLKYELEQAKESKTKKVA